MQVTFLGTGSAMPTGERVQTGLLVESEGPPLLVDCGSGVLHRLAGTETGYEAVDHVLLTHHHLDHVSDLLPLIKAKWLAGSEELHVAGPPGTDDLLTDLLGVHDYMEDRIDLSVREVSAKDTPFEFAGYHVDAVETVHSMPCHAYRIDRGGPAFTFSGDTEATEAVADLADGSAVLAHDCSFPDSVDVSNHPTPAQLGEVLAGRAFGTVYLTHLYPHTDGEHAGMLESIAGAYDGDVRFAREGVTVPVG
ncbi:MBL fold metallo-hydrolase [Halobacteriales archaeon QS_5_70_15]|nr:MAG: MBL fold metallo-hydrolase [Halobacteriales archaeon QS_5_70_15]